MQDKLSLKEWFIPSLPLPDKFRKEAYRLNVIWPLAIAFLSNLLSLALPLMILQVYDRIIPNQSFGTLSMLIIGVMIALMFDVSLRIVRAYMMGWASASYEHASSRAAIERAFNSKITEFERIGTGTHMQNISSISKMREFYSGQAVTALIDTPFVVLFLAIIAYLGGILVFVPVTILLAFVIFSHYAGRKLKDTIETRSNLDDKKSSYSISVLSGMHTAKSLAMESMLLRKFGRYQSENTKASYNVSQASSTAVTIGAVFGQISIILTATAGSFLVIDNKLSVGGLSACILLAGRALQPIQRALGTWMRMQEFTVSHKKAKSILQLPVHDISDKKAPKAKGNILLHNVSFSYKDDNKMVLNNININIEAGEIIAITGRKGSGKSTLLQIICGMIIPDKGRVRLDSIDPCRHSMSSLRKTIGYLPKQGAIFNGTILENMTGFRNEPHIIRKAKETGANLGIDSVINSLPKGYDTPLNDSPSDPIPPGIKQRISLVKVLLNDPAILIFDNADRSLDKTGYNLLFSLIGKLRGKCTIIISSYDNNLTSLADRKLLLLGGTIAEDSGHMLMKNSLLGR